jgi:hypothetical protein
MFKNLTLGKDMIKSYFEKQQKNRFLAAFWQLYP